MKVFTRAIAALLAGWVIALMAGCSIRETPRVGAIQSNVAAQAGPGAAPNPAVPSDVGYVQLGHLAPNAPSFNGYFARFGEDGKLIGSGGYGNLSSYMALPRGSYVWSMRPTDSPPDSPLTLTKLIEVKAGEASTMVLFNTGPQGSLQGVVTPADAAAPPSGMGKIRVVQGASGAPLSISLGDQPARVITYGTVTPYQNVPAGPLLIRSVDGDAPLAVDVAPGSLNTVLVTRTPKGVQCALVTDSILGSPLDAPTPTAVNTGSAGLAASEAGSPMLVEGLARGGVLLMLIAAAMLAAERRRAMPDAMSQL
jgi:hypothetical protein